MALISIYGVERPLPIYFQNLFFTYNWNSVIIKQYFPIPPFSQPQLVQLVLSNETQADVSLHEHDKSFTCLSHCGLHVTSSHTESLQFSNPQWGVQQFNSFWYCLPEVSIRRHRLRGQCHKTVPTSDISHILLTNYKSKL